MQGLPPTPGLSGITAAGHGIEFELAHASPTAKSSALIGWAKVALLAIGLGGAAAAIYYLVGHREVAPSSTPAASMPPEAARALVPGEAHAASETSTAPNTREASSAPGQAPRVVPAEDRPRGVARPLDRSLAEETKALDRAREALDSHRPSESLRLLDQYQRRFARGRLRPEAMVLRLAVLIQDGRYAAADSLGQRLLADEAFEAYAPRIRSLLREATP